MVELIVGYPNNFLERNVAEMVKSCAMLVKNGTGIAEVRFSNPVQS